MREPAMLKVYPLEEEGGYALVLILDGMYITQGVRAAVLSAGDVADSDLARMLTTELLLPMVTLERERLRRGQTREQAAAAALEAYARAADA